MYIELLVIGQPLHLREDNKLCLFTYNYEGNNKLQQRQKKITCPTSPGYNLNFQLQKTRTSSYTA